MHAEGLGTRLNILYDFLANAKAYAEKRPSVTRGLWLLALRARVVVVANLPVALYSVKKC